MKKTNLALAAEQVVTEVVEVTRPSERATGGGLEGAERTARETFSWTPVMFSPDQQINPVKDMADARTRDVVQNDGYMMGSVNTYRDSIVGSQYRLNAQPNESVLGAPEGWSDEFQEYIEAKFNLLMDSEECWIDASRTMTLTGLLRLAVSGFVITGEVLATAEWMDSDKTRPFKTALQMVSPSRLSNPDGLPDTPFLRRGIARDIYGAPQSMWIRKSHPNDWSSPDFMLWRNVPLRKPWGRLQVLHILDRLLPDQSRGIADMVTALKQNRMTRKFNDITLQSAVVAASYAASIESDLPAEMVYGSMGVGQAGFSDMLGTYMTALTEYSKGADNIQIDGVKMPHLFPGTKMQIKPMGTPGGVGTGFEQSLLRHTAAALGLSYEEFSRDYTQTNYSSARASMAQTWKGMQSKKKGVADKFASTAYALVMEEWINAGDIPLWKGADKSLFYDPVKRAALLNCSWIGASRGQIDEMKETQAAILRIQNGLSTYEAECARLGEDFRRNFKQRAREQKMMKDLGLDFSAATAAKPNANQAQQTVTGKGKQDNQDDDEL